jgi:hypothetical protein
MTNFVSMIKDAWTRSIQRRGRPRTIVIAVLLAVAIIWPVVNIGPRGPTLFVFVPSRGVGLDLGDLAAIFPLLLALALLFSRPNTRYSGGRAPAVGDRLAADGHREPQPL